MMMNGLVEWAEDMLREYVDSQSLSIVPVDVRGDDWAERPARYLHLFRFDLGGISLNHIEPGEGGVYSPVWTSDIPRARRA